MAKKVRALVKLQLPAGEATPAPPAGPALGQHGVNIMGFIKEYNSRTADQRGTVVPVQITVYEDRSFSFVTKTSPASDMLKKAASLEKGSTAALRQHVGQVSRTQLRSIAQTKMADLNAADLESAERVIEGTARSMGIRVIEDGS